MSPRNRRSQCATKKRIRKIKSIEPLINLEKEYILYFFLHLDFRIKLIKLLIKSSSNCKKVF